MEQIKKARRITEKFPDKQFLKVCVVCARTSQVFEDFMGQIRKCSDSIEVQRLDTNFNDATAIAQTVRSAKGDIIALIRGGCTADELAVFDNH